MRNAFASEITQIASEDPNVVLLSGDIGNRLFDDFKERYPDRFINCGVAEANMIGMAAGMAMNGLRPVAYTITPFITSRCLEQIRDDLCYQNLSVVLVGVGGGLSYAELGPTHHSCEDIGFLRLLPGMATICPGDAYEVRQSTRAALLRDGPSYIRLGKRGEPLVHDELPHFEIGKANIISEGTDICLLSTGNMLPTIVEVRDKLFSHGISSRVVSFHTVKPLDEMFLKSVFDEFKLVVTVEEHSVIGGLGGAISEWMSDIAPPYTRLIKFGTSDKFLHESMEQNQAREYFGLTPNAISEKLIGVFKK